MRDLLNREGLSDRIDIDSAGTGAWHVGEPPDRRARDAGKRRGLVVGGRARRVSERDFETFDYLIAMDRANLADLRRMAPDETGESKVSLFRSYDPESDPSSDVPDPYYGEGDGFERVLDICEAACRGLLEHLRETHRL